MAAAPAATKVCATCGDGHKSKKCICKPLNDVPEYTATFVDTHCHLDRTLVQAKIGWPAFRDNYNNYGAGYEGSLLIFCDPQSHTSGDKPWEPFLEFDLFHAAFGIHPQSARLYTDEIEASIRDALEHPKVVAYGECGLDYHYVEEGDEEFADIQKEVFARQIAIALEKELPLVIHARECEEDMLAMLTEHVPEDYFTHLHCFDGSAEYVEQLLTRPNCYIGLTGAITFPKATELQEVVKNNIPLERILLETDGPYMTPRPSKGEVCWSGHIPKVAEKIAELKGVSLDEVLRVTRENARTMYGI